MHRILFQVGSLTVYTYGVCIALGLIAAVTLAFYRSQKFGLNSDLMFNGSIIGFIFGMIGAKLLYIIVEWDSYMKDPSLFLNIGSGFVAYGGIILGIIAFLLYFKIKKTAVLEYAEIAIPAVSLGQAFGRVGCLMAGCCYGKPAPQGAWYGLTFPAGSEAPAGIPLYPVQIMCVVLNVLLCLFLIYVNYKEKFAGAAISLYMILYAFGRFLIEFLRNDPRGAVGPLSTSQFISIFVFIIGVGSFFVFRWYAARPVKVGGYPEDALDEAEDEEESEDDDEAEDEAEAGDEAEAADEINETAETAAEAVTAETEAITDEAAEIAEKAEASAEDAADAAAEAAETITEAAEEAKDPAEL